MMIQTIYRGQRGDMGIPEVHYCVAAIEENVRIVIIDQDIDSYYLTGQDGVEWGVAAFNTMHLAAAILNHLFGWQMKPIHDCGIHAGELALFYSWLCRSKPTRFGVTPERIIDIIWPGRFSWRKWWWRTRMVLRSASWLRILARKGLSALRIYLDQIEIDRQAKSPYKAADQFVDRLINRSSIDPAATVPIIIIHSNKERQQDEKRTDSNQAID